MGAKLAGVSSDLTEVVTPETAVEFEGDRLGFGRVDGGGGGGTPLATF